VNYYVLPGTTIHGGIKVGFQFCELLAQLGVRIVAATPDGTAPDWFTNSVAVVPFERVTAEVTSTDTIFFSYPHDHARLRDLPARLVFHCQGTDPLIEPVIADPDVGLLSCWPQAHRFMLDRTGRDPVDVGISVSDCFFYQGEPKRDDVVAFMPRRGAPIAANCQRRTADLAYLAIDGQIEPDCAQSMKRAGWYLATSVGEWFGLPSLEAMAAGCLVASVPVVGGMDFLVPDGNCLLCEPDDLPEQLERLSRPDFRDERTRLRQRGLETAQAYRRSVHRRKLARSLRGRLGELVSWA